ncbi:MAG: methyltransferase [Bacteroidales bacterium]|nr:methyltransferase [Bacteroidales bacterium]
MANTWFRCKQFTIYQEHCAHKVGTDSILLGSWVNIENVNKVFDIGAGCGILSLMIAQRKPDAKIFGVEIDKPSFEQALDNIRNSPWADRICIIHSSLQNFGKNRYKYDLIITNPPFFNNSLTCPDERRATARHTHTLTLHEIINFSEKHLSERGRLALVIPFSQFVFFKDMIMVKGWYINRMAKVYPNYNKPAHRVLIECSLHPSGIEYEEITIETNVRHVYTKRYAELTNSFYLNMKVEETIHES